MLIVLQTKQIVEYFSFAFARPRRGRIRNLCVACFSQSSMPGTPDLDTTEAKQEWRHSSTKKHLARTQTRHFLGWWWLLVLRPDMLKHWHSRCSGRRLLTKINFLQTTFRFRIHSNWPPARRRFSSAFLPGSRNTTVKTVGAQLLHHQGSSQQNLARGCT